MTQNEVALRNSHAVIGSLLMENIELKQKLGQLEEVIRQMHQQMDKKEGEVG